MSRYIDADKAKEKLGVVSGAYSCFLEEDRPYYDVLSKTIKMINEMPTADVVEVVRCEDCVHMDTNECPYDTVNYMLAGWDFCSSGERTEE